MNYNAKTDEITKSYSYDKNNQWVLKYDTRLKTHDTRQMAQELLRIGFSSLRPESCVLRLLSGAGGYSYLATFAEKIILDKTDGAKRKDFHY
jgi:hypothetical protein